MSNVTIIDGPEGRKIAYRREGAGKPLILIHGITEGSEAFEPTIQKLKSSYDVIAIDMAGHGDSTAPEIVGLEQMAGDIGLLIQTLALEDPLLVGHSYGGIIAAALSANGLGCGAILVDQAFELSAFREFLLDNIDSLKNHFHPFIDQLFEGMGMDKLNPSDNKLLTAMHAKADRDFVLAQWAGVLADDPTPVMEMTDNILRTITKPLLSIHSMDEATGAPYSAWFKERVAHADVEFWGDKSHWVHLVEPDKFCQRVKDFDPR